MKKIAVIGAGIMGSGIATNYLKHGYVVYVWNRSTDKLAPLIAKGALKADTPRAATQYADIIFEVTANDESSKSVWLGDDGILAGASPEKILIASATLSVSWIDELSEECHKKNFIFFDIPLTGSRLGAESGSLTLLVGGDKILLEKLRPDLSAISKEVLYFGGAGSGTRYKLLLNVLQAIHICAFTEILKIAEQAGMDVQAVGNALAVRPGGVTTNLAWKDYRKELVPINFSLRLLAKDLIYAKKFVEGLAVPFLDDALKKYSEALDKGMGEKDWTAVTRL